MANVDRPFGLLPVKNGNGSPWSGLVNMYLVPATDTTAIYVNDPVKLAGSSGAAGVFVNGIPVEGVPTITRCTDGTGTTDTPVGTVVGFLPKFSDLSIRYREASTSRIALVCDDPFAIFEAQEDADTTPLAAADIGLNIQFTTTAGSTVTGQSKVELDSTSKAATTTHPLRLVQLSNRPDNAFNTAGAGSDKAKFLVRWNVHVFLGTSGF